MKTFNIPFTKRKGLLWLPSEGIHVMEQELRGVVYRGEKRKIEDLGVLSRKLVTSEGVAWIAEVMDGQTNDGNLAYPVFGVGTNQTSSESIGDTLGGSLGNIVTGFNASYNNRYTNDNYPTSFVIPVKTTGTKTLILESTFNFYGLAGPILIKENFFCFGAITVSGNAVAALFDKSVLTSVVGVTSVDSIKFTYTLTFVDGG